MHRLLCLLAITLATVSSLYAQTDTLKLKDAPMYGHVLPLAKQSDACDFRSNHGEFVYSKESNVYSLLPGTVSAVFAIGKDHYMIVKTGDIYIVYSELKSCLYKKGDALDGCQQIGDANYSVTDRSFRMNVQAWRAEAGASREDKNLLLALVK